MRGLTRPAVLLVAVWALAGIPASAPAQEQPPLGGFDIAAWGSAVTWVYDQPGSPIPASPTAELHAGYSLATLNTGPAGHAVAAQFWPGEVAANVLPFIEASIWDGMADGFRQEGQEPPMTNPELVPKQYPAGAEATLPPGGSQTAPFAQARAEGLIADARTDSIDLVLPGVLAARDVASSARSAVEITTTADGTEVATAVGRATSTVKDVSVLDGLVKIEEVSTVARVTSDGETAGVEGRTVVSGLRIAGQGFTIDEHGIHAEGETEENPITGQLNRNAEALLADSGVRLVLAEPVDTENGARASRSAGGLILELSAHRLDEVLTQLPDELGRQLRGQGVTFTQTVMVVLASVNVTSGAAEAFEFDFGFDAGDSGVVPASGSPAPQVLGSTGGGTFDDGEMADAPVPSTPQPRRAGGDRVVIQPAFSAPVDVEGVRTGAVLLALLAVLGGVRLLRRLTDALVAPAVAACDET